MQALERWCVAARHSPWLAGAGRLWDLVRPAYDGAVAVLGRNGLERTINGTDRILVLPRLRGVTETYEPDVWPHLMAHLRPGDTVADVGAFVGLYTVALAKRVGPTGRVVAFEPDPENWEALKAHVELNGARERVELIQAAAGAEDGRVPFVAGRGSESRIAGAVEAGTSWVPCVRLDTLFADGRLDLLKIDVEGHEESVLRGALRVLRDDGRSPRAIYIEVHPYAWPTTGTSERSLLALLGECGYRACRLDGRPIEKIEGWSEVVAYKRRLGD